MGRRERERVLRREREAEVCKEGEEGTERGKGRKKVRKEN